MRPRHNSPGLLPLSYHYDYHYYHCKTSGTLLYKAMSSNNKHSVEIKYSCGFATSSYNKQKRAIFSLTIFGKDEVPSSNLGSSSNIQAVILEDSRLFCFLSLLFRQNRKTSLPLRNAKGLSKGLSYPKN